MSIDPARCHRTIVDRVKPARYRNEGANVLCYMIGDQIASTNNGITDAKIMEHALREFRAEIVMKKSAMLYPSESGL